MTPDTSPASELPRWSRRRVLRRLAAGAPALLAAGPRLVRAAAPPVPRTLASGLEHPWGLAVLADGRMLVTEKAGRLALLALDGRPVARLGGVPEVHARGQGGLLDVAARAEGGDLMVYLSYAEAGRGGESGRNGTAVARGRLAGEALRDVQVIFRQTPKASTNAHFGSRLVFDRDGLLFVTLGDRQSAGERVKAQDLATHHGKVVRIRPDGSVPADNPFVGRPGARPEIWSFGHRNPQGAALHPATGELWVAEHGPQGGDELNLVRKGRNYGWPRISYGCEYGAPVGRCEPVGGASAAEGLEQPVTHWVPTSIAPSGLCIHDGTMFPEWRGHAFVGALRGQALWRVALDGAAATSREEMYASLGERIRDVRQAPDGALLLLTDSPRGQVLRVAR